MTADMTESVEFRDACLATLLRVPWKSPRRNCPDGSTGAPGLWQPFGLGFSDFSSGFPGGIPSQVQKDKKTIRVNRKRAGEPGKIPAGILWVCRCDEDGTALQLSESCQPATVHNKEKPVRPDSETKKETPRRHPSNLRLDMGQDQPTIVRTQMTVLGSAARAGFANCPSRMSVFQVERSSDGPARKHEAVTNALKGRVGPRYGVPAMWTAPSALPYVMLAPRAGVHDLWYHPQQHK